MDVQMTEKKTLDDNLPASHTDLFEVFGLDATTVGILHRVASWAVDAIDSTAYASITLSIDGTARCVVHTSTEARDIERHQHDVREGPALAASATGRICRIPSTASKGEWPGVRTACHARGIMSTASFPLTIDGATYGALTLFSHDYHAFGKQETRLGRSFADRAILVLMYAQTKLANRHLAGPAAAR